jgi:hypothetical protein
MTKLINLLNDFCASIGLWPEWDEKRLNMAKEQIVERWKKFFKWCIDNWHIEKIESESKDWPDINDYIKYIATTEDPVKTLSDMIK